MLVYLGIPAHEANATNRIGVAVQNIAAVLTLRQKKALAFSRHDLWYTGAMVAGSIGGAAMAADISEQAMNYAIAAMLAVVLVTIFLQPDKWLRTRMEDAAPHSPLWARLGLFVLIGAYGGFIQAGVGLFILSGLILSAGYTLVQANILKLLAVLCFTLMALGVFLFFGTRLWWEMGLLMAAGQSVGAWLAARFMAGNDNARHWIRWLLIAVIAYSILRFIGLQDLVSSLMP